MIALLKTKYSDFVRNVLITGKGLNMTPDNFFLLKEMVRQCYDPELAEIVMTKWETFEAFIEDKQLEVTMFALAYIGDTYRFAYEIVSTIHDNQSFRIDGCITGGPCILFAFVPQYFAAWLNQILDAVPYEKLVEVAEGG